VPEIHLCAVAGCDEHPSQPWQPFCAEHWRKLPAAMRGRITQYENGNMGGGNFKAHDGQSLERAIGRARRWLNTAA